MNPIEVVLDMLGVYLVIGVVFGVAFAWRGAGRIDPVARHAPIVFRLLVLPGAAALWPVLGWKWIAAARVRGASP